MLNIPSLKDRVSAEEWQARVDLAACYRLMAAYGMTEMIANHISVTVPGTNGPARGGVKGLARSCHTKPFACTATPRSSHRMPSK